MAITTDSFLSGANAPYIADLYRRFAQDPSSVDPSWASFFNELHEDARVVLSEARGASWAPMPADSTGNGDDKATARASDSHAFGATVCHR